MIVADTSVWIELLRQTGSPGHLTLHRLVAEGVELAVTELVVLEILSGARSPDHARRLRTMLHAWPILPLRGVGGYEQAAELYRACRSAGEPIRNRSDCLVAVPTIEAKASLLTLDRDFETIARHSQLRIEALDAG